MREPARLHQSMSRNQSEADSWQEKKRIILENLSSYSTQEKLFKLWKNKYESVEDLTKKGELTLDTLQSIIKSQPDIDFSKDRIILEMQNRIDKINTLQTKEDFDALYPNPDKEIIFLDSLRSSRTLQTQQIEQLLNKKLIDKTKREAKEQAKHKAEEQAKRKAEVKAKKEAEVKAKREVQEQAKREAEAKAKLEAEEQAKLEAEEQAKREAEEKSQKTVAKQQRRAEYIQKESIIEILDQIVKDVTRGLATELAIEERSRLEEEDRIKSKTLDDAVDRVENKIIDELLPELVNKVVDELLPELVNKVVDELLPELVNEIVEEIVTESFAEAKTEEKAKIEAEGLNEFIAKIISEIITEIEAEGLNEVRTEEGPELRTEFGVKKEDEEIIDRPSGIVETQNDKEISFEQEKEQQSLSIIEKKINELKRYKAEIDTKLKDLKMHLLTSSDMALSQYKLAISQEQSNSSDHLYIRNLERLAEENKLARRETNITEREGELGQKFIDRQEVKNEAELRAEIEAELRAKIEAELRAKIEAELRAKIESEVKASLEADYKRKIKSDENVLEGRLKQEIEDAKEDFKKEFIAKAKKENEIRAKKEAEIKIREAEIKKTVDTYQKLLEILKKNNSQRLEEKDKKDKEITNLRRELGELRLKLNSLKNPKPDPTTAPLAQPPQVSLKKDKISRLNDKSEIEAFLSGPNRDEIKNDISKNFDKDSLIVKILKKFNNTELGKFITTYESSVNDSISRNQVIFSYMMESIKDDPERLNKIGQIVKLIPNEIKSKPNNYPIIINEDDCHELIFSLIENKEISSADKIKKINFIKAFIPDSSWQVLINKKKDDLSPLEYAVLRGDPILVEHLSIVGARIEESDIHKTIQGLYTSKTSNDINPSNKAEILKKILTAQQNRLEIINQKLSSGNVLLDHATRFDENFSLTLIEMGAKIGNCKDYAKFIKFAFNSSKFESFVENSMKNGEVGIFGSLLGVDCENLIHHLSIDSTLGIKDKIRKLNLIAESMNSDAFLDCINQKDIKQCSPLDLAINQNDKEFAKELIEKGARVSESWQVFYYSKKLDIMKKLYEEGLINFTKFPSELQSFKKSIDDDLNPQNATLKQSFLSFINEKLELEQQNSQGAQGTFLLPTPSQAPTVPGLGILPKPADPPTKTTPSRSR